MIKVLHLINGEHYAGAERVQDLLGLRMRELGVECGFACLKSGEFDSRRKAKDVPLFNVNMSSRFDLRCVLRVVKIVKDYNYSVIHTHTPRAAMIGRLVSLICQVPFVHHVHSPTSRDSANAVKNYINAFIENWSLSGAKRLIAVSQSLQSYLTLAGFGIGVIDVVPNGVPIVVQPAVLSCQNKTQFVFGMVALFRERKGTAVFIRALHLVRSLGYDIRIRLIGEFETPEYQNSILSLSKELQLEQFVEFSGFVEDVETEIRNIDVLVLPSLFGEGMPMVILEAMALGRLVISTEVEGISEALENGESGIIVRADDVKALAAAMVLVASGEKDFSKIAERGRARQILRYSDLSMAKSIKQIYQDL